MKCSIKDPRARHCSEGYRCYRCGFEQKELRRRKYIPLTPATIKVPFTDWTTGETNYLEYDVERKVIPK